MIIFCIFLYEDEINLPTYLFSNNKLINKNWMPNRTITKWFFVQRKTHFSFYRLVLRYQFIFQYLVNPPCCACDGIVISTMSPSHRYPWSLPSKHLLFLKTSSTRLYRNSFTSSKTSWRRLGRRKIVTLKTSWRHYRHKKKLGISVSHKSKCVSNKSIFHKSIPDNSKANPKGIN